MILPSKKLWEILVPKYSNQGLEYNLDYHHKWDEQVRKITGGMTILRTAKGQWVNPKGITFIEEMIPVRIYCNKKNINKIIDFTIKYYNQEAIFAYRVGDEVIIKRRTFKNPNFK
jgi:hypothetical protein